MIKKNKLSVTILHEIRGQVYAEVKDVGRVGERTPEYLYFVSPFRILGRGGCWTPYPRLQQREAGAAARTGVFIAGRHLPSELQGWGDAFSPQMASAQPLWLHQPCRSLLSRPRRRGWGAWLCRPKAPPFCGHTNRVHKWPEVIPDGERRLLKLSQYPLWSLSFINSLLQYCVSYSFGKIVHCLIRRTGCFGTPEY